MNQKPEGSEDAPASAERAVERLSEDERLRGSLEDDGFASLLTFASYLALDRAQQFATTDALYLALRRLVAAAVEAAERGSAGGIVEGARDVLKADELKKVAVPRLSHDRNRNARAIALALSKATGIPLDGAGR
jgi:hypothetical protein